MFTTVITAVILIATMIGFNAMYVAGEFAAVSARRQRIYQSAQEGSRLAKMLLPVLEDHHRLDSYIAASQVGITLSSIVLGIYGQQQIAPLIAPLLAGFSFISDVAAAGVSATLVLIILTTLQVVFGELVPKSLALRYPEKVALATAIPMRWSADIILRPLIILLNGSGALLLRILGASNDGGHKHVHSPEEIEFLISQSHEGGLIDAEERELLVNAFRVGELTAGEIVVPRTRMVAASLEMDVESLLRFAANSGFTRIPVYATDIDHIVGFVHLKELFRLYMQDPTASVKPLLRQPSYVPETMIINEVWKTLDKEQSYLAIVFDEYGGTTGMITREDLIEELFGELQDEFDEEKPAIASIGPRQYRVRGDVLIAHLNSQWQVELHSDEANTIGGLVLYELGHVPKVGEEISIDGFNIKVQAASSKTIDEVIVTLPETFEEQNDEEDQ